MRFRFIVVSEHNMLHCIHESQMKTISEAAASQIFLLKRSQVGRKDTMHHLTKLLAYRDGNETCNWQGIFFLILLFKNKSLGRLCDFVLTLSAEELKRRLYWNNFKTVRFSWESCSILIRPRCGKQLFVPHFTEGKRRDPAHTSKTSSSERVFTAGDGVLTILYTASLSQGTQVGSVELHTKAI